jgi:GDP-fucose transporter C1
MTTGYNDKKSSNTSNNYEEEDLHEVVIDLDMGEEDAPFLGNGTSGETKKGPIIPVVKEKTVREKAMAVAFYWVVSLSLVFLNKQVMVGDILNLDAPLFMSWTQFVITVICCTILGKIGRYFKPFSFFPPFEYKLEKAKKVMPLTIVFLGMIVFNNLCLKFVEVSFYQVARSLTIVFNIILTYLILGKKTNNIAIICCVVIVVGYLLGCDGEVMYSTQGIAFGVLSSVFVALNAIYVKKILPKLNDNSEMLMIYNNLNAVFLLPIFILFFTDEVMEIRLNVFAFESTIFWSITAIAGIFGFLINFASYIQIKFTNPLSHNVSGTAKAAVQTVIALYIFQNPTTIQGLIGVTIVILGSFAYSRVR